MTGGEELPDVDTALLGKLNSDAAPAAAPHGADVDQSLLGRLNTEVPAVAGKPGPATAAHSAAPTRFHKSAAPAAAAEPEMSWGDVASSALHNAPSSAAGVGKSMLEGVLHPIKTLEAVGDLGKGAVSQAMGAVGVQQDPKAKAANEKLISALEDHYKTTYGSVRGFKRAVATDPVSIAMDASTVIPGLGAGADAAGLARTAGVLRKVGSAVDPVTNALRVAKLPARIVAPIARQFSGMTTGVPADVLKLAGDVGAHPDPAVRAAYKKFATGQGDATEFQRAAQGAVQSIRQDMSDAYLAQKGPLATKPVSLNNTYQALQDAATKAQMGSTVGQVPAAARKVIGEAASMISDVASNPGRNTIEHIDALKRQIWDLKNFHPELADNYLNGIYHGIKADLVGADKNYANLMEKYQTALQNVNDLTKTMIGGKSAAASASFAKSMRAMKTGTGTNLMSQLMEKDPTIGAMLAGQATHPWHAGGRSFLEAALSAPAAATIAGHPAAGMIAIPASLAASSPRLAGALHYGAGAVGRRIGSVPLTTDLPYYAGRTEEENQSTGPQLPDPADVAGVPDMDTAKAAVSGVESAGSGGYDAIGPTVHHNGITDHGIGKYMVMASNVPAWTARVLGRRMTPEEFHRDAAAQEKVFEAVFGGYLAKTGNMRDALALWHSGAPYTQAVAEGRHDVNMTTKDYVKKAGFKRGGQVGKTHEQLVERLMKMVKAAKKGETEHTKPLLTVPDDAVASALHVAQRAI